MDVSMLPEKAPETSSTHTPSSLEHNKADRSYVSKDSVDLTNKTAERKLLLKLDLCVLPVLSLLFLVSFVDRSNVANARIQGLEKSLGIPPKSNGYNIALFSFTIPYILFEVPANITLKKIKPQWWLSGLMFAWGERDISICRLRHGSYIRPGICTMCQGFSQSLGGLAACRALMGFFESGFVPGARMISDIKRPNLLTAIEGARI